MKFWKGKRIFMADLLYNNMIEGIVLTLKKMVPVNEPGTMEQYKTMPLKDWDKFKGQVDAVKNYVPASGKLNKLMEYFNDTLYPLLNSGKIMKMGLMKKAYGVRVDDYDFRQMLSKIDTLMQF